MNRWMLSRRRGLSCVLALSAVSMTGLPGLAMAQTTVAQIGFAAPLSGGSANYGKDMQLGMELALSEANAQKIVIGGKPVTFEAQVQDDQGDPHIAVQDAQHLVDMNVVAVVGHFNSGPSLAASAIYNRAGIPQIIPASSSPKLTLQGYKLLYRPYGTDNTVAQAIADYAVKELKGQRIAVVDDRTAYGQGLAEEFERSVKAAGGSIIDHEYTNDQAVDFRSILTTLKSKRADVVFFAGLGVQGASFAKQARQVGFNGTLMAGATFVNKAWLALAGPAAEGMYAMEQGGELAKTPAGKAFLERFHAKFGTDPVGFAAFSYNAAWVVINGMKAANSTDPKVFGPAIAKLSYDGVFGKVEFDRNGDLKEPKTTMYKVVGGAWIPLRTVVGH